MARSRWFPLACAGGVLLFGLVLTLGLYRWHGTQNETIARQQLAVGGGRLADTLQLRIASFNDALHGLRGALAGNEDRAERYRDYSRVVDLSVQHPGALAFGYAERVSQENTAALLARLGQRHQRPVGLKTVNANNGDRFIVSEATGDVLPGTDLASFGPVREAGMRATWTNQAVLSPPVRSGSDAASSFYFLLPVYRNGSAPDDSMLRHDNAVGWLFIHLSGEYLMRGIADPTLQLKLVDRAGEDEEVVVFDRAPPADEAAVAPGAPAGLALRQEFDQQFGGRSWHFIVTPSAAFWAGLGQLPPRFSLDAGLLVSLLAALLTYSLLGMQGRATALAERMTVALRQTEERQRAILQSASIGILFTSERRVQHCNPAAAVLFGWDSADAMRGQAGSVFWPTAEDYAEVGRIAGPVLAAGGTWDAERPMRRHDGSSFLAHVKATAIDPAAAELGTIWIVEDVTEQRQVARQLQDSERHLAQILGGSPMAIFVIDTEHRVTHWNLACENLTGLAATDMVGKTAAWRGFYTQARPTMADLIVGGGSPAAITALYGDSVNYSELISGAVTAETYFPDMQQTGRWLHFMAAPLYDGAGRMTGAIETLEDVTPRKRVEQALADRTAALQQANVELGQAMDTLTATQAELIHSEKLAALGAMVAGVAHELNTPIGNALIVASSLRESSEEAQRALASGLRRSTLERFIGEIADGGELLLRNLNRAAELVRSFKRVAVNQADALRSDFQLAVLVAAAVKLATASLNGARFTVQQDVPPELQLNSFPGELELILVSLIDNAVSHGFAGREHGEVRISAGPDSKPDELVLEVRDNGKGIAAEILPRIFDPFFTTSFGAGGNGLGLYIVYNQVTGLLGGRIDVTSTPDAGTCFRLHLPRRAP